MAIKPAAATWSVKEQIVEDLASGLLLRFSVCGFSHSPYRLTIVDKVRGQTLEFLFDDKGKKIGASTIMSGPQELNWLKVVK